METRFMPDHAEELESSSSKIGSHKTLSRTRSGSFTQSHQMQEIFSITAAMNEPDLVKEATTGNILSRLHLLIKSRPAPKIRLKVLKTTEIYLNSLSHIALETHRSAVDSIISEVEKDKDARRFTNTIKEIPRSKRNEALASELLALLKNADSEMIADIANSHHWYTDTFTLLNAIRGAMKVSTNDPDRIALLTLTKEILNTLSPHSFQGKYSPIARSIFCQTISSENKKIVALGDEILSSLRTVQNASKDAPEEETEKMESFKDFESHKHNILKGEYDHNYIKAVAKDLRQLGMNQFMKIMPEEFSRQKWSKDKGAAVNLLAYINSFNNISAFVTCEILSHKSRHERANMASFFIQVAACTNSLNDQHTTLAIIAGLSASPVDRLKQTWSLIPRETRRTLEILNELYTPTHNFKNLRSSLKIQIKANHNLLPTLGVYLKDLTFIDDGNPSKLEGKINIQKLQLLGRLQLEIFKLQKLCKSSIAYATDICDSIKPRDMNEDKLYEISNQLEGSHHHHTEEKSEA